MVILWKDKIDKNVERLKKRNSNSEMNKKILEIAYSITKDHMWQLGTIDINYLDNLEY